MHDQVRRCQRYAVALVLCCMAGGAGAGSTTVTPPQSHAALLYETYCGGCHTSLAHRRQSRRARSAAEVATYVRRWSDNQKLGWSDDDVGEVTDYLILHYYRFAPVEVKGAPRTDARGLD